MVRVITPKGELKSIKRAVAVCEMRNQFNGRLDRRVEIANDLNCNPTGLCFDIDVKDTGFGALGQEVFIGNLKTEKVQAILRKLLKEGYFDFSELEYQKAELYEKTVFDEGKSKPYTSDYITEYCPLLLCGGTAGIFAPGHPIVSTKNAGVGDETEYGEEEWEGEEFDD